MKKLNVLKAVVVTGLLAVTISLKAQGGGLQVYAGYLTGLNNLEAFTPNGVGGGLAVGADARLLGGGLHFLIGGRYAVQSMDSGKALAVSTDDTYSITSFRIGIGFKIFELNRHVRFRSKLAAAVHFVNDLEMSMMPGSTEDFIPNDSYAGAVTGIGVDLGHLTIDLEYEYGLINAINQQAETTIDYVSLTAGVFF